MATPGAAMRLPVLPGSFVYSAPAGGAEATRRGALYRVVLPTRQEGQHAVVGQECLLDVARTRQRKGALSVFEVGRWAARWRPNPREVWAVDHLVEVLSTTTRAAKLTFDFARANREIAASTAGGAEPAARDWEAPTPASEGAVPSVHFSVDSGYSPFRPDLIGRSPSAAGEGDGLTQAALQLERLRLAQSSAKTGNEGRLSGREPVERGGELEGEVGAVGQPCQYASMH